MAYQHEPQVPPLPAQDLAAERRILGALLRGRLSLLAGIRPDEFYRRSHQLVAEATVAVYRSGMAVTAETVSEWLRKKGLLDAVGDDFLNGGSYGESFVAYLAATEAQQLGDLGAVRGAAASRARVCRSAEHFRRGIKTSRVSGLTPTLRRVGTRRREGRRTRSAASRSRSSTRGDPSDPEPPSGGQLQHDLIGGQR